METIKFVDVGEGITEGHVRKWLVRDGDQVKEDQTVVQVETDKAVVNVPSPIGGTIKIAAPEGATLHVGDLVAEIGTAAELKGTAVQPKVQQPAQKPANEPNRQAATATAAPAEAKAILTTPAVRKLARDLGVDISKLTPTGPHGRLVGKRLRIGGEDKQGYS